MFLSDTGNQPPEESTDVVSVNVPVLEFRLKELAKMATFGLFKGSAVEPSQKVEGDEMELVGDTVKIFAGDGRELVAAFRLDVNQHVRKM
jgi:hypothetical protein